MGSWLFLGSIKKGNAGLKYTAARTDAGGFADCPHHAGGIRWPVDMDAPKAYG
jgi:hypothetical protein